MKTLTCSLALVFASLLTAGANTTYTVKTGDTVYSIAKRYQTSAKKIIEINKISDPSSILIGQKLSLPAPGGDTANASKSESSAATKKTHTVSKGDTFYSIAKSNKLKVSELKALNPGVDIALIQTGQELVTNGKAAAPIATTEKKAPLSPAPKKEVVKVSQPTPTKKPTPKVVAKKSSKVEKSTPQKETTMVSTPKKASPTVSTPKKETPVLSTPKKETPAVSAPEKKSEPSSKTAIKETVKPALDYNSVIVSNQTSLGDFAQKHNTSIEVINNINGWNLGADTPMARGSEIYVPK